MSADVAGGIVNEFVKELTDIVNTTLGADIIGTNGTNSTDVKFKASPEGLFVAYSSLVIMAMLPIWIGAFKSVKHQHNQVASGEEIETMSTKEAMMFPVIASITLFSIYIVFQIFSKEYINLLLAFYFFLIGIFALTRAFTPFVSRIWPKCLPNEKYDLHLSLYSGEDPKREELILFKSIFGREAIVAVLLALAIGVWYFMKKLNKVTNGCILLGGLFFYDIFWVFGTNVMVSVAKSFDAPIKLIFPQDLIENGFYAEKFAILGLGDIVIPGIFIALLLRFDISLNRNSKLYFYTTYFAYFLALLTTIFVMHVFKHAQPALLYIVPLCLIFPLTLALIKGDLKQMFSYQDHEENPAALNASTTSSETGSQENEVKKTK